MDCTLLYRTTNHFVTYIKQVFIPPCIEGRRSLVSEFTIRLEHQLEIVAEVPKDTF